MDAIHGCFRSLLMNTIDTMPESVRTIKLMFNACHLVERDIANFATREKPVAGKASKKATATKTIRKKAEPKHATAKPGSKTKTATREKPMPRAKSPSLKTTSTKTAPKSPVKKKNWPPAKIKTAPPRITTKSSNMDMGKAKTLTNAPNKTSKSARAKAIELAKKRKPRVYSSRSALSAFVLGDVVVFRAVRDWTDASKLVEMRGTVVAMGSDPDSNVNYIEVQFEFEGAPGKFKKQVRRFFVK